MMNTLQNTSENNIRRRLDFSNEETKPKKQTTNVHSFLNSFHNKPKTMQSDPNMNLNMKTNTVENVNNTPKKQASPRGEEAQKYAGGGYSKSPNPKALGKPGIQSPNKPKSPEREFNHTISAPSLDPISTNTQNNLVRYDSESFFKIVSTHNIK